MPPTRPAWLGATDAGPRAPRRVGPRGRTPRSSVPRRRAVGGAAPGSRRPRPRSPPRPAARFRPRPSSARRRRSRSSRRWGSARRRSSGDRYRAAGPPPSLPTRYPPSRFLRRAASTFPDSWFPFPVSRVRRTAPAHVPPRAYRRIGRSGARCRGARSRRARDRLAGRPAARRRSWAPAAEAGVSAAVIEQGPAVRDAAPRDQPEEHGVIPARGLRLLVALDARERTFEDRNAVLGLPVADAVEPVGVFLREAPGDRLLVGCEHVQHEALSDPERGIHVVLAIHRHEHERRLERHGSDRARRHADRAAGRVTRGEDRHARRKATEQLAELSGIDAGHISLTTGIGPGRSLQGLGVPGQYSRSRSPEDPRGLAAPPGGRRHGP